MAADDSLELMAEADRRGILPPDKKALFDEAKARGLVKGFESTPGGAATGNPNIQRGGEKALRTDPVPFAETAATIGGAGAVGAALGAVSGELAEGAGNVIGALPYPAARTVGGALKAAAPILKAGRGAAAVSGGAVGAGAESIGQVADMTTLGQQNPVVGEATRIVAGGLTGETLNLAKEVLHKYAVSPALGFISKAKHEAAKSILEKLEKAPQTLTVRERKFIDDEVGAIRGGAKSDAPLEQVGSIMGQEADNLISAADRQLISATRNQAGAQMPGNTSELATVGGNLRDSINKRNEGLLTARRDQYAANQQARDAVVATNESSGRFVNNTPEYKTLLTELTSELTPGKRSPSVQVGYQKILNELTNQEDPAKPITFQALDDVRRKLGDAFRGKPAEGYDALGETLAKDLYGKVSEIQKKFAGPTQAKLLDDYASATPGLESFSSRYGKKATALDQYREGTFATDPSSLPSTYFKTRESINALKELTGNPAQVKHAAMMYADKELAGMNADQARKWMGKNSEWLSEVPSVQQVVNSYATRLEAAERSFRNATDFAAQAAKDATLLKGKTMTAQRAVDLISHGNAELWEKVIPAIKNSPQATQQMVAAVRQVVAEQATSKGTLNLFQRKIRPFMEQAQLAPKKELDYIAKRLENLQAMNVPEEAKLGFARRMLLNSAGGWAASVGSRAGVEGVKWAESNMVPQ